MAQRVGTKILAYLRAFCVSSGRGCEGLRVCRSMDGFDAETIRANVDMWAQKLRDAGQWKRSGEAIDPPSIEIVRNLILACCEDCGQ